MEIFAVAVEKGYLHIGADADAFSVQWIGTNDLSADGGAFDQTYQTGDVGMLAAITGLKHGGGRHIHHGEGYKLPSARHLLPDQILTMTDRA